VKFLKLILIALLLASVAANVFLAIRLRGTYERYLIRSVWPAQSPASNETIDGTGSPTILLLGDSRLADWKFDRIQQGRIVNDGIRGGTTAEVLANTSEALKKYHPDVVVIESGINDLLLLGLRTDLKQQVVQTVLSNLDAIVSESHAAGAKVLLLTIWPPTTPSLMRRLVWSPTVTAALESLNDSLVKMNNPEKGISVVNILNDSSLKVKYRDTLHLEPETYRDLTPRLESLIQSLTSNSPRIETSAPVIKK